MDSEWQFSFAFYAIDGSHLPMKCPLGGPEAMKQYHEFKNFYSIILLALVDPKYRFSAPNIVLVPQATLMTLFFFNQLVYEKK